jgi:hypothetical protein
MSASHKSKFCFNVKLFQRPTFQPEKNFKKLGHILWKGVKNDFSRQNFRAHVTLIKIKSTLQILTRFFKKEEIARTYHNDENYRKCVFSFSVFFVCCNRLNRSVCVASETWPIFKSVSMLSTSFWTWTKCDLLLSTQQHWPGVDVMITIFCDFCCLFSAKKLENQCYDPNFCNN